MIKIVIFCLAVASTVVSAYPNPDIVNGSLAPAGLFPYLAHIKYNAPSGGSSQNGSAVLISERFLISKAENLKEWGNITVTLGALNLSSDEPEQQIFQVNYDDIIFPVNISIRDDIAIIPLPRPANLTNRVQPVLLPRKSDQGLTYHGFNGFIVGWVDRFVLGYSAAYKPATVRPNQQCGLFELASIICVADNVGENVDLGGPIVIDKPEGHTVIGLYYFDSVVGQSTTNVFIRVNEWLDYISNNTGIAIRP